MDADKADALLTVLRKHNVRSWLHAADGTVRIELADQAAPVQKSLPADPIDEPLSGDPETRAKQMAGLLFLHEGG